MFQRIGGAVRAGADLASAALWTAAAFGILVGLILGIGYSAVVVWFVAWVASIVLPGKLRHRLGSLANDAVWVWGTGVDKAELGAAYRLLEGHHLVSRNPSLFPCKTALLSVSESDGVAGPEREGREGGNLGRHVEEENGSGAAEVQSGGGEQAGEDLHTHLVSDQRARTRYCLCGTPLEEAGGVVVLLHGVSMTCDTWAEYCEELGGRGYAVLVYDMWGHGHSSVLSGPRYTPALLCAQLRELLSELRIRESIHLVGFSLGSLVATLFATTYPESIRTLTLIAPAAGFNNASEDFVSGNVALNLLKKGLWAYKHVPLTPRVATYLGRVILSQLAAHVCPSPAHLLVLRTAEFGVHTHHAALQYVNALRYLGGQWLHQHRSALRDGVLRSFVCDGDLLGDYSHVVSSLQAHSHPILVVYAGGDALVPPSVRLRLAAKLPRARLTVIEGAGHNVPMHGKEELLEALTAFLSEGSAGHR